MLDYTDEFSRIEAVKAILGDRFTTLEKVPNVIKKMEQEMKEAAVNLQFEKAAEIRDVIRRLKVLALSI